MYNQKKHLVKIGYDEYARRQLGYRHLTEDLNHLTKLVDRLKPNAKILDVGCGNGLPVDKFLIEKGFKVTGVDISPEQIKLVKQNLPKGNFKQMDMANISFPSNHFDAIVSFHSIYHVPRNEHESLAQKFYDMLVDNGYLMITMGIKDWETTGELAEDIIMFWSQFDRGKNLDIVRKAGFKIIYEEIYTSGENEHLIIFAKKH
jgi:cyclopropane fatty-acyl-phospholipid synthase-like methyltransferase